jgi:GNAT superfamily N-acetyltransferase
VPDAVAVVRRFNRSYTQRIGVLEDSFLGLGMPLGPARLLRHLEDRARGLGHGTVRLDTNAALTEAITMYERAGYRAIPRYTDNPWATNFFEKPL